MITRIAIPSACLAFTGCASIVNDSTHPMKVETKTEAGQVVAGAECKLTNDYGSGLRFIPQSAFFMRGCSGGVAAS